MDELTAKLISVSGREQLIDEANDGGSAWSFESPFYDAPRIAQQLSKVKAEFQCINSKVEVGGKRIATVCFQFFTPCWITRSYFPVNAHELTYYGQPVARCATEEALTAALRLFQGS